MDLFTRYILVVSFAITFMWGIASAAPAKSAIRNIMAIAAGVSIPVLLLLPLCYVFLSVGALLEIGK